MEHFSFFRKYKVFITGLIGAVILAVVNIDATNGLQWGDLVMPVLVAVAGYVGINYRGQWSSIIGIALSTGIGAIQAVMTGGKFQLDPITLQFVLAQVGTLYFGIVMPQGKPRSYEHDPVIVEAKQEIK